MMKTMTPDQVRQELRDHGFVEQNIPGLWRRADGPEVTTMQAIQLLNEGAPIPYAILERTPPAAF